MHQLAISQSEGVYQDRTVPSQLTQMIDQHVNMYEGVTTRTLTRLYMSLGRTLGQAETADGSGDDGSAMERGPVVGGCSRSRTSCIHS